MQCATCGNDNLPQAQFCARCGSVLPATAPAEPEPSQPVSATPIAATTAPAHAVEALRVSVVSATICMFLIGMVAGMLFTGMLFNPVDLYYAGYYGGQMAGVYSWIGIGLGVATSLGLSSRLRLVGRLPSALGIVLLFVWTTGISETGLTPLGIIFVFGVAGLGVGLLFPLAFWRLFRETSSRLKVALPIAVAAIAGLSLGYWSLPIELLEFSSVITFVVVALVIGLPAVLISPIVRKAKQS